MNSRDRAYFDELLEQVLEELPPRVHALLEEIPLLVEDHPSPAIMRQMGVRHRSQLCGLYTGVPLTDRSVMHSGVPSDVVQIYREGIMSLASDHAGRIDADELRRQIRITVLHELAHHHGFGEEELEALGY